LNLAVHREDFNVAAQYMQMSAAQRRNAEQLARDLTDLIDRHFTGAITSVSDAPGGAPDDGLPLNRERVVLNIDGKRVELGLVRVKDPQGHEVWLVASQTLADVPTWRRSEVDTWLDRFMPDGFVQSSVLGAPLARWIGWAATLVIPFGALWLASALSILLARGLIRDRTRRARVDSLHADLRWLVITFVALGIHVALVPSLGFSLGFRIVYARLVIAIAVIVLAWLLWRLMAHSFERARRMAQRRGRAGITSLLLLAERVGKALIVMVAIFVLLTIAGVDTSTALAGVGIGGVALALGAQKSVENLLGGVFLVTDNALAIGDFCSISNRVGMVEDITMRSVRLRTVEQTLLSVPAGILSQSNVENFATRHKILIQSIVRLRYGTTADQLRCVLSGIRTLLDQHPEIEPATSRIRLVDFGERAIELELFAYVLTPDYAKFLSVREELLLTIATIVEAAGTEFAQPTLVYQQSTAGAEVGARL
jgi:MscS family membrane protein